MIFDWFLALSISLFSLNSNGEKAPIGPRQIETFRLEEDRSAWVVFCKKFGEERVLVRFPQDPLYGQKNGVFFAMGKTAEKEELWLFVCQKSLLPPEGVVRFLNSLSDPSCVAKKLIETKDHFYCLQIRHGEVGSFEFELFSNSFNVEFPENFKR